MNLPNWFSRFDSFNRQVFLLLSAQTILCIIDLISIPGTDLAQFNVIIILISFLTGSSRFTYLLAFIATNLTILDLILPPDDIYSPEVVILLRRAFGILNFWAVAFVTSLLIKYKKKRDSLLESLKMEKLKVQQSNKELENFAAVAAHDLSSPLRSIVGWADMLEESQLAALDPVGKKGLNFIKSAASRCSNLVEELLEMARVKTSTKMKMVPLDAIVHEVLTTIHSEIEDAQADVIVGSLPMVKGNENHFSSLFSNLIRNAVIYRDKKRALRIEIGSTEISEFYEIFVRDNGSGIAPSDLNEVFEIFKRAHVESDRPGTGIGLALCKKIVDLMGAKIWVESDLGLGSTFRIKIPKSLVYAIT